MITLCKRLQKSCGLTNTTNKDVHLRGNRPRALTNYYHFSFNINFIPSKIQNYKLWDPTPEQYCQCLPSTELLHKEKPDQDTPCTALWKDTQSAIKTVDSRHFFQNDIKLFFFYQGGWVGRGSPVNSHWTKVQEQAQAGIITSWSILYFQTMTLNSKWAF